MDLFSSRLLWNGFVRSVLFWLVLCGTVYAASRTMPFLDLPLLGRTAGAALGGQVDGLSTQAFAFALASLIAWTAIGFVVAYWLMYGVMIPLAIADARRHIARQPSSIAFAEHYDAIHKRLSRHPLIGHAWRAFDQATFRRADSGEIQIAVRPASLINIGNARERLNGLKMMGSIPGYFVGVGLFLTFIGLVLALYQASAAVSSSNADGMQVATRKLLEVATFKFATSIAGLGSSIILSIAFRIYTVWIEAAFDRFNHVLEDRLHFLSSQSIGWTMNESLAEQLVELKQINGPEFFAKLGSDMAPQLEAAFANVMVPITRSIDEAMSKLTQSSQSGVTELLEKFTASLHHGAGSEMRELGTTLQGMREALTAAQSGIGQTGEDFGRRMAEVARKLETLQKNVQAEIATMDRSQETRRKLLATLKTELQFEGMDVKVDEANGVLRLTMGHLTTSFRKRRFDFFLT